MLKAHPFLKWAGSKRQLLPELLARVPEKFTTYHEPFLGGGALFFELAGRSETPMRAVLSDSNSRLIRTWTTVRDSVGDLVKLLQVHATKHYVDQAKYYYKQRARTKTIDTASNVELAAWFIYMNKTCFNGLYRVNGKGEFNVPMGSYKNPVICDEENLHACSLALAYSTIECRDFRFLLKRGIAWKGDFVYFDPPYVPLSKTSHFTAFTKGGFTEHDQEELARLAKEVRDHWEAHVLVSNSSAPLVRKLYKGWKIEAVSARRAINSKADKRGEIKEYLIS